MLCYERNILCSLKNAESAIYGNSTHGNLHAQYHILSQDIIDIKPNLFRMYCILFRFTLRWCVYKKLYTCQDCPDLYCVFHFKTYLNMYIALDSPDKYTAFYKQTILM